MADTNSVSEQIVLGIRSSLADQWDGLSTEAKEAIRLTAVYAAKLAARQAAGDTAYVEKNAPHIKSMLADVEAIAAIGVAAAFWETIHKLADIAGSVLVSMAKKAIGLP